jgi:hypothetical protein
MLIRKTGIQVLWTIAAICLLGSRLSFGQYETPNAFSEGAPFGGGLLMSPEVGNVEGIQQFGNSLRTDPDVGIGYTYRVFPSARKDPMDEEGFLWALAHVPEAMQLKAKYQELGQLMILQDVPEKDRRDDAGKTLSNNALKLRIAQTQLEIENLQLGLKLAVGSSPNSVPLNRYSSSRNTLDGFRAPNSFRFREASIRCSPTQR